MGSDSECTLLGGVGIWLDGMEVRVGELRAASVLEAAVLLASLRGLTTSQHCVHVVCICGVARTDMACVYVSDM